MRQHIREDGKVVYLGDSQEALKGLGDAIGKGTKALGLKECGRCRKRRRWLNKVFPFKRKGRKK